MSKGSQVEGTIEINSRELNRGDYGKVGAFVQQDDVLSTTSTVRELLEFSAQIRTTLSQREIDMTVDDTIRMMGLGKC